MSEPGSETRRLLVLDDENDVAATICLLATSAGHEAAHTDDEDEFLERVAAWEPTHVMVDLQLRDRDGVEVLHQLAEMGCTATVIVISGLGGRILDSSARAAAEHGLFVAGTLSKPFTRPELLAMLEDDSGGFGQRPSSVRRVPLPRVTPNLLTEALAAGEFVAHFQPKISCGTRELVGFEVLARWPQPGGGMIPPNVFIGLAEEVGLIHDLTRQIFRYALANRPGRDRESGLMYALNLSQINLSDETFPRWLLDQCDELGLAPSRIILEVTETASMDNPLALLESLTQFRIRGFHLSIDDFGVGYSSLVQLARLPFSELKIDQMFVKDLQKSAESRKIVSAVVGLGKSMELNVVAEGVEDAWALEFLCDNGCDEAQGYFIARPMDSVAADQWAAPLAESGN